MKYKIKFGISHQNQTVYTKDGKWYAIVNYWCDDKCCQATVRTEKELLHFYRLVGKVHGQERVYDNKPSNSKLH